MTRTRFRAMPALVVLLLISAVVVGCEDDSEIDPPLEVLAFTVGEDSLSPDVEQVRIPDRYQVVVTNESDEECSFYLGPFVRDLNVSPGETSEAEVQLPPDAGVEESEMGCDGHEARQGRLEILTATGTGFGN